MTLTIMYYEVQITYCTLKNCTILYANRTSVTEYFVDFDSLKYGRARIFLRAKFLPLKILRTYSSVYTILLPMYFGTIANIKFGRDGINEHTQVAYCMILYCYVILFLNQKNTDK